MEEIHATLGDHSVDFCTEPRSKRVLDRGEFDDFGTVIPSLREPGTFARECEEEAMTTTAQDIGQGVHVLAHSTVELGGVVEDSENSQRVRSCPFDRLPNKRQEATAM